MSDSASITIKNSRNHITYRIEMKKTIKVLIAIIFMSFVIIYLSLYVMKPSFMVKEDIQEFLDKKYDSQFKVVGLKASYSPDFLHQAEGYELVLQDSNGVQFTNVFIQKNAAQNNWLLFRGTNIMEEYNKAKSTK